MPGFSRAVFLGLQAAALLAAVGPSLAPLPVVAAPVPISHIADYASQPPARTNATLPHVQDLSTAGPGKDDTVVDHTPSNAPSVARRQDFAPLLAPLRSLLTELSTLLPGLASLLDSDPGLQAVQQLLETLHNLDVLDDVGQQKGLANYDPNNQVETLVKNVVNAIKYFLNAFSDVFNDAPAPLGQVLGRTVYLLKCIIDAVLDSTENVLDGTINDGVIAELQALLAQLTKDGLSMDGGVADGLSADAVPAGGMPDGGMPVDGLPMIPRNAVRL
ncbi:hypothetical protein C8T65DRAFT_734167 [Cerioporus squamosus]|nr:hypothetical protein C8T65DRAFT_734167 [Cerioporus squamosus]